MPRNMIFSKDPGLNWLIMSSDNKIRIIFKIGRVVKFYFPYKNTESLRSCKNHLKRDFLKMKLKVT